MKDNHFYSSLSKPLSDILKAISIIEEGRYNIQRASYSSIITIYPTLDAFIASVDTLYNTLYSDMIITNAKSKERMYMVDWVKSTTINENDMRILLKKLYTILEYRESLKKNEYIKLNDLLSYYIQTKYILQHIGIAMTKS